MDSPRDLYVHVKVRKNMVFYSVNEAYGLWVYPKHIEKWKKANNCESICELLNTNK